MENEESEGYRDRPIRGMESVVATVSGYHGSERFNLIKLVSQTGANYVGTMMKSTTHLVCWKFEGRKCSLAKNFRTVIVNHRWFEDCMKKGKRLPEHPYMFSSGQEVGPLLWEIPVIGMKQFILPNRKVKVLSDRSNICNDGSEQEVDIGSGDSGHTVWVDSHLLTKQQESSCFSSTSSARQKRSVLNSCGSTSTGTPTRKERRLVRKNAPRDILESAVLHYAQECYQSGIRNPINNVSAAYDDSHDLRNGNALTSHRVNRKNGKQKLEDIKDITNLDTLSNFNDPNSSSENALPAPERSSLDEYYDYGENMNGEVKESDSGQMNRFPISTELSCVICWTEFSSTRGILPCGHRFCYSCIQSWADHMASRRKISTCPLCKASFGSITKVDGAASCDQKIYSQTIPSASSTMDIFMIPDRETPHFGVQSSSASVCCKCLCREPEDLLINCHLCQIRCIHSYCLDPLLVPWTCSHCRDVQMLYYHF